MFGLDLAELTAQQRAEQIAEWIRLTEEKQELISRQLGEKKEGRGRPEGGRAAATREIGVSETQARRAEKIASLSDEAKERRPEAFAGPRRLTAMIMRRGMIWIPSQKYG